MKRAPEQCVGPAGRHTLVERVADVGAGRVIALLEPLVTQQRRARLAEVLAQRLDSVTLVMDAPHDPHNGAAVLRSCDAFGVTRVHVVERHERFLAGRAVALGAQRWVEVLKYGEAASAVQRLRADGFALVATHPRGELGLSDLARFARLALVLGNEHAGIGSDLASSCAAGVRVPMRGFVESLNLSVTAAILVQAATAGRPGDLSPERRRTLYAAGLVQSVPRARDVLRARGLEL